MIRERLRKSLGLAVLITSLLTLGGALTSLAIAAEKRSAIDPLEDIQEFAFGAGEQMKFDVGWNGIPAARLEVSAQFEMKDGRPVFRYVGSGQTLPYVRLFYTSEEYVESVLDVGTLSPLRYHIKRTEKGSLRTTTMVGKDGVFQARRVTPNSDTEHEVEAPGSFDPFSVIYMARSLPLEVGETYTLGLVDGRERYQLTLEVEAREVVRVKAGTFDALRIRPELVNLDDPGEEGKGRVRKVRLWLTNDRYRVPVRMESDLTFGRVYGELTSFTRGNALRFSRAD